ncbi:hypothetical protein [Geopsychrobacter electrodiphilus]|uniref:hypothetical protein n=1 Tax=Geopsychrobacter electrodiphilus TaxID=225196 RepID=UPI000365F002|nr:hypothetical protein [Geopsychrobacter electrodiphilus]
MIPLSVSEAWNELPENKRTAVCRQCAKKQPTIFARWIDAAGLKSFRHDSVVNRKVGAGLRLDAVLFKAEEGQLAADVLVAYFTELAPEINNQYLALIEEAGNEEPETKLEIYAQLARRHKDSPFIRLYLVTALWVEEFHEEDIKLVDQRAAELSESA